MRIPGQISMVIHAFLLFCGFAVSNGIPNNVYENMDVLDERGTAKKQYSSNFLLYGMVTFSISESTVDEFENMSHANACVHVGARVEPMHLHEEDGGSHIVAQTDLVDERYIIYGDNSAGAVSVCLTFIPRSNQGASKPYLMEMKYNHTSNKHDVSLLLHIHAIQYVFGNNQTLATCVARQKFLLPANRQRVTMDVDMQRDSCQFHDGSQMALYRMGMNGIEFERIIKKVSGCYNESMAIDDVLVPREATWPHMPCSMKYQRVLDTSKHRSVSFSNKDAITGGIMVALLAITVLVTLLYVQLVWKTSPQKRDHHSEDLDEASDVIPAIHKDYQHLDQRKSACISAKNAWKRDPSEGRLFRASKQRMS